MSDLLVRTPRLDLRPLGAEALEALVAGDRERLGRLTRARLPGPAPPPHKAPPLPLGAEALEALVAGDRERLGRLTGARFRDPAPPPYMADSLPVVRDRL